MTYVPLKVLIIDEDPASSGILAKELNSLTGQVLSVATANSVDQAADRLQERDINCVFIDPLSFGVDGGSEFIFSIRRAYSTIVFVLYLDFNEMERISHNFFAGKRARFRHYYKLNKQTPVAMFRDELLVAVSICQQHLGVTMTDESVGRLQQELQRLQTTTPHEDTGDVVVPRSLLQDIGEQLKALKEQKQQSDFPANDNSVFLSYRFAEKDLVEAMRTMLEREGFTVVTGQDTNTYIGQGILSRIKHAAYFLCLMTKVSEKSDGTFTTSPWLLEEKGAALAFGKKIVLMVEEGIDEIGGLQGDWQRIHFTVPGFTKAAYRAVDQLKSYGKPS